MIIPKSTLGIISIVLVLWLPGCSSMIVQPTASPTLAPTSLPSSTPLPTLQPTFLADPNTACFLNEDPYPGALTCLDRDGWHVYSEEFSIAPFHGHPWPVSQCPDGRRYLVDLFDIYALEGRTLVDLEFDQATQIEKIICGPGKEIWVGSSGSVSHFDGSSWIHFPQSEYLGSDEVLTQLKDVPIRVEDITIDSNGKVWVVTDYGLASYDGVNWQVFEGSAFDNILAEKHLDSNGNLWIADGKSLHKFDGLQWSAYEAPRYTTGITLDQQNRVWLGTQEGIYVFDPQANSLMQVAGKDKISDSTINALQFDQQGRLWVATDYGINIYDGSNWTTYHVHTANLFDNSAQDLVVFGDGPQLPAPALKEPGSLRGKWGLSPNTQVELCVHRQAAFYSGHSPCYGDSFHALATAYADGEFEFAGIPAGNYYLLFQEDENSWGKYPHQVSVLPGKETLMLEKEGVIITEIAPIPTTVSPPSVSETQSQWFFDFSDGEANGWNPVSGEWTVLAEDPNIPYAQISDPGGEGNLYTTFYTENQFTSFELSAEILSTSSVVPGSFNVGLALRGNGSSNYYRVLFHPNYPGGALRVEKIIDGVSETIVPVKLFTTPTMLNRIKVTAAGDHFQVFINGYLVADWIDSTYPAGYIGLTTENGSANFDNITIRSR